MEWYFETFIEKVLWEPYNELYPTMACDRELRSFLEYSLRKSANTSTVCHHTHSLLLYQRSLLCMLRHNRADALQPKDVRILLHYIDVDRLYYSLGEHWVPICFPVCNPYTFLHCYICALHDDILIILLSKNIRDFLELQKIRKTFQILLERRLSVLELVTVCKKQTSTVLQDVFAIQITNPLESNTA
uniref:Vacuolar fusion protein MON1 homolog n=1 Tax=Lygus hesperus TaxID=30085 RepID=A0A0A9WTV8_LYGHE